MSVRLSVCLSHFDIVSKRTQLYVTISSTTESPETLVFANITFIPKAAIISKIVQDKTKVAIEEVASYALSTGTKINDLGWP